MRLTSHVSEYARKRQFEPNVIEKKLAEHRRRPKYFCQVCHHGPLRDDGGKRCRARLCLACWYERHNVMGCTCPAMTGDPAGVYACQICPEMATHTPEAKASRDRMLQQAWLELEA